MFYRRSWAVLAGLLCVVGYWTIAEAQGPGGRGGRFGGGPAAFPVMQALDADHDGELSAKEIENATVALKTLDKDKNGKLTRDELFGIVGNGRGRGLSGEVSAAVAALMTYDKNSDGKLSKDELPDRLKPLMDRADANKDGFLDRAEVTGYAQQRERRGPGGAEGRGGEGGAPQGSGSSPGTTPSPDRP